jgi:hypothetical protein
VKTTTAYVDHWARAALGAPAIAVVALAIAGFSGRQLWSDSVSLTDEEERESPPIVLPASWIGGVSIDVSASLPDNHWGAYQISVLDKDGQALLEVVKEAWAESGIWHEDGESGNWSEQDTDLRWDVRVRAAETVKVVVSVLETGKSGEGSGEVSSEGSDEASSEASSEGTAEGADQSAPAHAGVPITVNVVVRTGIVDERWLLLGLLVSVAFAVLAFYMSGYGGRPVIVESNSDSEVKGRAVMGGPRTLTRVSISGVVDETAPPAMKVRVTLRDEAGRTAYERVHDVIVNFRYDEGEKEDGRFAVPLAFELPDAGSWGVFVEARPDEPMESLKLVVRDRATTRGEVIVEPLKVDAPKKEAAS